MNELESRVRDIAKDLHDQQLVHLFKVPEAWEQTPCDFFGYTIRGQAVMIECKQVKRNTLPLHNAPGLKPHQLRELIQAHQCGVKTFVLWQREDLVALIDAKSLDPEERSIPWAGCNTVPKDRLGMVLKLFFDRLAQ